VDVVLPVGGEVVVDDEADLLDVNAAGEQVCRDQNAAGAGPELPHDHVTLLNTHETNPSQSQREEKSSDADPDPNQDPPDSQVFGPLGSGSGFICQWYGSGSYHQAKKVRKTLIPTAL
jgi:hypothetical protein